MYTFQITLHARPPQAAPGGLIALRGRTFPTLAVPREALSVGFALSFEDASARLAQLPRLFIEPDGSFVWVSPSTETTWQVDGVLYDRDGRLLFIDLKGRCPAESFDRLLAACGWPGTGMMCQLTREAVFVDEATFRAIAAVT